MSEWEGKGLIQETRARIKTLENTQGKARQGKARQDKTRQDKTRQDKTRQDKTRQDKTRQDKTRQDKTRQLTGLRRVAIARRVIYAIQYSASQRESPRLIKSV